MKRQGVPREEIIAAYQRTGTVWAAAKELGLSGQTVHERLVAIGYPLAARNWTAAELAELRSLVGTMTIGEIARRLGRPYAGVAIKISRLGLAGHYGAGSRVKIPRGAGYDKASVHRYTKQIDASGDLVTRFARRNGLTVEALVRALEKYEGEWWLRYRREHSDTPEATCPYCQAVFVPSSRKQRFCSRKCGDDSRRDLAYFGGKRRTAVGMAEGRCQLCARVGVKGLSAHHLLGKENDPEDEALAALCPGCHHLVTNLAGRGFIGDEAAWESLIHLVWLRKNGHRAKELGGLEVVVDIDELTSEQMGEWDEYDQAAEQYMAEDASSGQMKLVR